MSRLFLAIPPSAPILRELTRFQQQLGEIPALRRARWTHPEDFHLTLHFLGESSKRCLPSFRSPVGGFEEGVGELIRFPDGRRTRVLGVGSHRPSAPLLTLWEAMGAWVREQGFETESRPYVPHITLGRFRDSVDGEGLPEPPDLRLPVASVALYESDPGKVPRYRILQEFALDSAG